MKKNVPIVLFLILLSLTGVAQGAEPKLVIDQMDFHFGQIYQGEKVTHAFSFRNLGDAPLQIQKVRTSCGCTAALPTETLIAAGETGEIRTTFDSGRFRGEVIKTVYLYTNDPVQPVSQLHIRGTVQPEIELTTDRIDLGILTPEQEQTARVDLTNRGRDEIVFSSVETTAPELQAEIVPLTLAPAETGQIVVRAVLPKGVSRLNGYVIVQTSSSVTPQLSIPVYGAAASSP